MLLMVPPHRRMKTDVIFVSPTLAVRMRRWCRMCSFTAAPAGFRRSMFYEHAEEGSGYIGFALPYSGCMSGLGSGTMEVLLWWWLSRARGKKRHNGRLRRRTQCQHSQKITTNKICKSFVQSENYLRMRRFINNYNNAITIRKQSILKTFIF